MRRIEVRLRAILGRPIIDAHGILTINSLRNGWLNASDIEVRVESPTCQFHLIGIRILALFCAYLSSMLLKTCVKALDVPEKVPVEILLSGVVLGTTRPCAALTASGDNFRGMSLCLLSSCAMRPWSQERRRSFPWSIADMIEIGNGGWEDAGKQSRCFVNEFEDPGGFR